MTIKHGEQWGKLIHISHPPTELHSDRMLSVQEKYSTVFMAGGNLASVLGHPTMPQVGEDRQCVQIDALRCEVTLGSGLPQTIYAVSGIFIGSFLKFAPHQRRFVMVSNTGVHQSKNFAPRAHPNDGRFDVVSFAEDLSLRERIIANKRLLTGTHIPHPGISVHQTTSIQFTRKYRHEKLSIDGQSVRDWVTIEVNIEPDYWNVIV